MAFWISSDLWYLALQSMATLLFVSLGVYLPMRAGVLVLGAEGIMLFGCFGAIAGELLTSGGAAAGLFGAVFASLLACALFAAVAVSGRVNPIVTGIALNFIAAGGTAVLAAVLFSGSGGALIAPGLESLPKLSVPVVEQIPWVGKVLSGQTIVLYLALFAVPLVSLWLHRTRGGLTMRVVGQSPSVALDAGRSPSRTQWLALLAGGVFIGLGASQLALASAAQFSPGMTSGRGFIALALVLIAATRPWLLLPLAIIFAYLDTLGFNLQNIGLSTELSGVVPYLAILVLLSVPSITRKFRRAESNGSDVAPAKIAVGRRIQ
ncbi:ABC transporter permease [Rhodococcus globerulus]|uniref:ABC transporter permease n=1 Tax=Rhodococcus globerulus TaxID=33008 RepID=A0ABU4C2T1_RHOGO|nr:ABC transporter permease [Rhodococcus globerulus]MDV6270811.1 ABC transporter permease [Rhodococcus globerulus]